MVLDLGVSPEMIIYANPCKQVSHLRYACKRGVATMTFDNEVELHKVCVIVYIAHVCRCTHMYIVHTYIYTYVCTRLSLSLSLSLSLVPRPHPPYAKGRGSGDIRCIEHNPSDLAGIAQRLPSSQYIGTPGLKSQNRL